VQVLVGVHGDPVRSRQGAEGRPPLLHRPRHPTPTATDARLQAQGRVGRLPHGAEAQDVPAQAAGDGEHRRDHRAARPGEVAPAVDPRRPQPQRLLHGGDAALAQAHPDGARIGGQPVDVVEGEARVRHRRQAGVDGEGQRVDHQPAPDRRPAGAGQHRPVLEPVVADRRSGRRTRRLAHPVDGVRLARRFEQREPHVIVLLEADDDLLADVDRVGVAPDDVGREVHRGVLSERDVGDHVGRLEPRQPLVVVDGVGDDGAAPRHHGGPRRPAPAAGAHRDRRMDERLAALAALDPQATIGTRRPEPLVDGRELGERAHRVVRTRWTGTRPRGWRPGTTRRSRR
jgi:hypothetical protein